MSEHDGLPTADPDASAVDRRNLLKGTLVDGTSAAAAGVVALSASAQPGAVPGTTNHYHVPANHTTVHWGYFSKSLKPLVEVASGDFVTIEVLTHHANDDAARMVTGDPGAESVFHWDRQRKGVDRRGAGPMQPTLFGRGAGEGLGVHICTGPMAVRGAEPGDVLEVRIVDVKPRPCANAQYPGELRQQRGRVVGLPLQGAADRAQAARGHHDLRGRHRGRAELGQGRLQLPLGPADRPVRGGAPDDRLPRSAGEPLHDPGEPRGVEERAHPDPAPLRRAGAGTRRGGHGGLDPLQPRRRQHRRLADRQGAVMYYPVAVPGALFSAGDSHASQGDSELCGTAIECSLTGTFQLVLPEKATLAGTALEAVSYPLLETQDEWVLHGFSYANYLAELGADAQSKIYEKSSVDLAMKDTFQTRHFLMTTKGLSEDEAISLMSVEVDFGITQVVDGNWGVHAIVKKSLFAGSA